MSSIYESVLLVLSTLACIITISLNVVWIVRLSHGLSKSLKSYKRSTRTRDGYRPIYKQVESISQSVNVYNLKTDIIKLLFLIGICVLEIWQTLYSFLYRFIFVFSPKLNNTVNLLYNDHLYCNYNLVKFFEDIYLIFLLGVEMYSFLFLLFLLTILTRLLSARYLLHPVRRSIIKYLVWFLVQLLLITLASTTYTYPLYFFIIPSFAFIDLLLLVRESITLRNVLKMNVNLNQTYSSDCTKFLSHQQLLTYKHYKLFRLLLLLSLFVALVAVCLSFFSTGFKLVLCLTNSVAHLSAGPKLIMSILSYLEPLLLLLFLLFYGGPLWIYSIANVVVVLMRSYSSRKKQYRFNYSNTNAPMFIAFI